LNSYLSFILFGTQYFLFYDLVPAVAACVRRPAAARCLALLFYYIILIIHYLLFITCNGSMLEASCGRIVIYVFFIYYLVPAAASCGRRPAAA
jgi:hypothetical protein